MNRESSFCEKIEMGMLYSHPKAVGPKPKRGQFGTFKVSFGTPKVPNGLLGTECYFVFRCVLDSPSKVFWSILAPRHVFILRLWFFFSFLDNSGFFRNNYLVDKYPKINLDKVQIIHNFIVIQSSFLFLCMHPYFKHWLSTNHKII